MATPGLRLRVLSIQMAVKMAIPLLVTQWFVNLLFILFGRFDKQTKQDEGCTV